MELILIMKGKSFLRDAIGHFFSAQVEGARVTTLERVSELEQLEPERRECASLVLVHIEDQDAGTGSIRRDLEIIRAVLDSTPVVLLGNKDDPSQSAAAIQSGARGYIPIVVPAEVIRHALPLVAEGGVFAPPYLFGVLPPPSATKLDNRNAQREASILEEVSVEGAAGITAREAEVLRLLGAGLPNKLIAHRLNLAEGTIKVHMRNIMRKLRVSSRTQAALFASRRIVSEKGLE